MPFPPIQGGSKPAWSFPKASSSTMETESKKPFPPIQGGSKPAWSRPKASSSTTETESKTPFPPIQGGSKPAWSFPKGSSTMETESKKPFPPIQGGSKPAWSPPKASSSTTETESKTPFPPIQGGSKPAWSSPKASSSTTETESKNPFPPIQGGSNLAWVPPKASGIANGSKAPFSPDKSDPKATSTPPNAVSNITTPFPSIQGGAKPAWVSSKTGNVANEAKASFSRGKSDAKSAVTSPTAGSTTTPGSINRFPPNQSGTKPAWMPSKADGITNRSKPEFLPKERGANSASTPPTAGSNTSMVGSKTPFAPIQSGTKPAWMSSKVDSNATTAKMPVPPKNPPAWMSSKVDSNATTAKMPVPPTNPPAWISSK
eukprot:scaffold37831_cov160-Amphora_coffeaeformis.AAC.1